MLKAKFVFLLLLLGFGYAQAFNVPVLSSPVMDQVGMLDSPTRSSLEELLRNANQRGHIQLQILIVKSLEGETIEQASIQVTDKWKLGDAKKDNGVLLMISKEDRKIRFEIGQGLEGDIPDVYAKRIIDDSMTPYFRDSQFSAGVAAGVYGILRIADPELMNQLRAQNEQYQAPTRRSSQHSPGWALIKLIFIILFILFRLIFWRRSGFWFGGFGGGGGSWGGGGGGFSGGGASGGW